MIYYLNCRGVAQLGSALLWGSRGRGFKSRRSDSGNPLNERVLQYLYKIVFFCDSQLRVMPYSRFQLSRDTASALVPTALEKRGVLHKPGICCMSISVKICDKKATLSNLGYMAQALPLEREKN